MRNNNNKNQNILAGLVLDEPVLKLQTTKENFYKFRLGVKRLSEVEDIVTVTIPEKLLDKEIIKLGNYIEVIGPLRSHNKTEENMRRLFIEIFPYEMRLLDIESYTNRISLEGTICKKPVPRKNSRGMDLCDVFIAVNNDNRSDYIPCVLWGKDVKDVVLDLDVGSVISINGRLQSRTYSKRADGNVLYTRTILEVSANKIEILN